METFDYIKIFFAIISFVFTGRIIYESFNHKPTKNYIFVLNQLIRFKLIDLFFEIIALLYV